MGWNAVKSQLRGEQPLEGKPESLVITSHICRGNYNSTLLRVEHTIQLQVRVRKECISLLLEHDDERSGSFEALTKFLLTERADYDYSITTKSPRVRR